MLRTLAAALAVVVAVPGLAAQRTFVASYGNDADPCSLSAPCRGFAAALSNTTAGGEVIVLDSAGYGVIGQITQSVSIIAPSGVYAGIAVFSGTGISVDGVGPFGRGIDVALVGLSINGMGGQLVSRYPTVPACASSVARSRGSRTLGCLRKGKVACTSLTRLSLRTLASGSK